MIFALPVDSEFMQKIYFEIFRTTKVLTTVRRRRIPFFNGALIQAVPD